MSKPNRFAKFFTTKTVLRVEVNTDGKRGQIELPFRPRRANNLQEMRVVSSRSNSHLHFRGGANLILIPPEG